MKQIERLAIANRGEVAVRIINACKELGIETILLHSKADVNSVAYRLCDIPVCIGESAVNSSYLNIQANIDGAIGANADAIHPGFGFLSENADFAEACLKHKLIFVGPSPESIRLFGDKISAKKLVEEAGGPVIPGYDGDDQSEERLVEEIERIGLPAIVKASSGGGGRGLKIIRHMDEAREAIQSAKREGKSSFGSDRVFLEKYLDQAKHIEIQIFGDVDGQAYALGERECSVQRRHQKIIEEALSPSLTQPLREKIYKTATRIAEKAKYRGAGTVEFLFQDNQFYFLEMNTRLQVEHPVTEAIFNVDLVKNQILVAQEIPLLWKQEELRPRGHAIECRLYAEDPYNMGMPSTGELGSCVWPTGPGRRFEVGFEKGDTITSFYDSMIAKVIVWDESRPRAIEKMKACLAEVIIFGVKTNIAYLQAILSHPDFVDGSMNTGFISKYFPEALREQEPTHDKSALFSELIAHFQGGTGNAANPNAAKLKSPWYHNWGDTK